MNDIYFQKKAVLVSLLNYYSKDKLNEYLDEISFLSLTLKIKIVNIFTQKILKPNKKTFIGKGKLFEISSFLKSNKINIVIFDTELLPFQLRNIENFLCCKVIDRSLLILNIFSMRAKTFHSKIQIELAKYQYLLPRLTNMWSHLSRQKGGIGMRGPGESELETDRRIIKEKIFKLRKKLDSIGRQNSLCFKSKKKIVNVSIIGYANVGKSTLMDLISKSNAYKENMFFSTIDSTSRKVVLHSIPFLLNDTVGFIRNLPNSLFNCFKSTLSEIKNSDILIHIVDLSNSLCDEYIDVVLKTLNLVGIFNISIILLFNKIDLILDKKHHFINSFNTLNKNIYLKNLKINYLYNNYNHDVLFISSEINYNIFYLKELLYKKIIYEYKNKGYVNF